MSNPRPVPHINHTVALAHAATAVANAVIPGELQPVRNVMNVHAVRTALINISEYFEDSGFASDNPDKQLQAVEYLVLLATLLREHLKAGNT